MGLIYFRYPKKNLGRGVHTKFLSIAKTYSLERIFGSILVLKSSFTKLLEHTFFLFLYKTCGDALIALVCFEIMTLEQEQQFILYSS
jgi:hypothetical protein